MPSPPVQSDLQAQLIAQTLEDEHPELSSRQIHAALQQAGGSLEAARVLCDRAAASRQRCWWPASQFCAAPSIISRASSSSSSSSARSTPRLVPHQVSPVARSFPVAPFSQPAAMQPSPSSVRDLPQPGVTHQSPAAVAVRRQPGSGADAGAGSSGSGAKPSGPGILKRSAAAAASPDEAPAGSQKPAPPVVAAQQQKAAKAPSLQPHYAAVFLTDKSRRALLQHVPPLHEAVSADHMTLAYRPSLEACARMPLGREAALFVAGVAADYRAQAVAVQHPSWLPFTSDSTPHVTVSVGEEVPPREAGELTATALDQPGALAPVARLKLLQGVVGVQLTDGSRVFSTEELQAALAAAAQQQRQQAAASQPASGAPKRILQRGAAAPPLETAVEAATEAAAPPPAAGAAAPDAASKAAAWDLDSLLDQLHLAEQPAPSGTRKDGSGGSGAASQPRRGLLKLPATVAAEMAAPGGSSSSAGGARAPVRPIAVRRPAQPSQTRQAQRAAAEDYGATAAAFGGGDQGWQQAAAALRVQGKSVAEEAEEAAAGEAPLDMVASLASLLPSGSQAHASPPACGVLAAGAAAARGHETSSSSIASTGPAEDAPSPEALVAVDPEHQHLLQLQFPALHELVAAEALRLHGGSLPEAACLLASLQREAAGLAAAQPAAQGPQQATLGAFLQQALPASGPSHQQQAAGGSAAWDASPAGGGGGYADSSYDFYAPPAGTPGAQQRAGGRGGGGRSKGGRAGGGGRRPAAGDDPMSVAERQAMNLHMTAKRLYSQAAQEAFATGQAALGRELQATARSHSDAAGSARRRANLSAFRSTNAAVTNTFTLDLHGQHVDEALQSLERYLLTLGGLGHPGGVVLQVITGRGAHSVGGQPRLLPAVVRMLSDAGFKFDSQEDNPGVINVLIGC